MIKTFSPEKSPSYEENNPSFRNSSHLIHNVLQEVPEQSPMREITNTLKSENEEHTEWHH